VVEKHQKSLKPVDRLFAHICSCNLFWGTILADYYSLTVFAVTPPASEGKLANLVPPVF